MKKMSLSIVPIVPLYPGANAQANYGTNHNVSLTLSNQTKIAFTASYSQVSIPFFRAANYRSELAANKTATLRVVHLKPHNITGKVVPFKNY